MHYLAVWFCFLSCYHWAWNLLYLVWWIQTMCYVKHCVCSNSGSKSRCARCEQKQICDLILYLKIFCMSQYTKEYSRTHITRAIRHITTKTVLSLHKFIHLGKCHKKSIQKNKKSQKNKIKIKKHLYRHIACRDPCADQAVGPTLLPCWLLPAVPQLPIAFMQEGRGKITQLYPLNMTLTTQTAYHSWLLFFVFVFW